MQKFSLITNTNWSGLLKGSYEWNFQPDSHKTCGDEAAWNWNYWVHGDGDDSAGEDAGKEGNEDLHAEAKVERADSEVGEDWKEAFATGENKLNESTGNGKIYSYTSFL